MYPIECVRNRYNCIEMKQQTLGTRHFGGDQEQAMVKIPGTKFGLAKILV